MLEVLRTPYFVVSIDEKSVQNQIIRVMRTHATFPTIDVVRQQHLLLISRLDRFRRNDRSVLVDLREAPARRDPEFEAVMKELRPKMFVHFRRIGVLTASALGLMQVRRHSREDGIASLTSTSEAELLAFLNEGIKS